MSILHLTLKKKWFDMIASGEKKEEYREIKPYWFTRLVFQPKKVLDYYGVVGTANQFSVDRIVNNHMRMFGFAPFDTIIFTNGYGKNAPTIEIECKGITIGNGNPEWGGSEWMKHFVIKLGNILSTSNITQPKDKL